MENKDICECIECETECTDDGWFCTTCGKAVVYEAPEPIND